MTPTTKEAPAWLVEQAAQGELDSGEIAHLRARLSAAGRSLDSELEELRRSDRQILTRLPRETMGAAIRRRMLAETQAAPRSRFGLRCPPLALAATLGLVIMLVARGGGDGGLVSPLANPPAEETVIKGDEARSPRLLVYRQRPGRASDADLLADGARGARGDVLQLAYDKAPEGLFGVLISIDGAGKVTQHLPEEGASQAAPLVAIRELRLPSAYELDDAPGFERFVLVTAAQPFAIATVRHATSDVSGRRATAGTQPLPLPASYRQTSVLLNKMREGNP